MAMTTSNLVTELHQQTLAIFDPMKSDENLSKINAIIAVASKLKDWPLLLNAVEAKVEEQARFVGWWDGGGVRRKGGVGGYTDNPDLGYRSVAVAESQTGISQQQVSRWRTALEHREEYQQRIYLAACRKAHIEPEENFRAEGTGENEWFTPPTYIEAARTVLGTIDLDPATHPVAQQTIKAERHFTKADNALTQTWTGPKLWLNPPYARGDVAAFIDKFLAEYIAGNFNEAIVLTHNYTDTSWWQAAVSCCMLMCFTKGRIKFLDINGQECAPTQGQTFFYYGSNKKTFYTVFRAFGFILQPSE